MAPSPRNGVTIDIDAAWIAQRGVGPFLLDRAGATYVLKTDVRTEKTAFVVVAADITLDLNGHTVTYGDSEPLQVRNGGFEEGVDRSVPGWDLGAAPDARLADNTRFLFGHRVLRFEQFTAPQRIVSDPIAMLSPGRPHVATITPANNYTRATVTLSVVDAQSGEVQAKAITPHPERGFSAVVHFTPRSNRPVRLRVDVVAPKDVATSVDLDEATLHVAGDHGIVASLLWSGQLVGFSEYPLGVQKAYDRRKAAHFAVRNGKILQGRGQAYGGTPLFFHKLPGIVVERVETLARGIDTDSLDAGGARQHLTVRDSTFRHAVPNITNRMRNHAALLLADVGGPIVVEGNRLLDCPQAGIVFAYNDATQRARFLRNEIRQNTVVSNGYAMICSAARNLEIRDNVIRPENGRGIDFDSYTHDQLADAEVVGNVVDVQERPNREYPTSLESMALRLRNVVNGKGTQKNLNIHDNQFIARCGPGLVRQAYAGRISYLNRDGAMKDAHIVVSGNTFRALATSPDPGYHARALVLDLLESGVDLTLRNNRLESNDVALGLADSGGGVADVTLQACTFHRVTDGPTRRYTGILAGCFIQRVAGVKILDLRCENGARPSIAWAGTGSKEVQFAWLVDVRVVTPAGDPVPQATVNLVDRDGKEVYTGRTGKDGTLRGIEVLASIHRQDRAGPRGATEDQRGPYRLVVVANGKTSIHRIIIDRSQLLTLTLPGL